MQRFKRRFCEEPTQFGDVQLVQAPNAPDFQVYFDSADKGIPEPFACTMVFVQEQRRNATKKKRSDVTLRGTPTTITIEKAEEGRFVVRATNTSPPHPPLSSTSHSSTTIL